MILEKFDYINNIPNNVTEESGDMLIVDSDNGAVLDSAERVHVPQGPIGHQ